MMSHMPVDLLKNIADQRPRGHSLLGMDVGKNTIGLALSDPDHRLATPLQTIWRSKFTKDIQHLKTVIEDYEIGGFVIGLPVNMDDSEGPRAQSIRDFALEMKNHPDIFGPDPWVALWDERLSTVSVERFVDEFVDKKSKRRGAKESGLIDKLAAQVILQGALDYLSKS